MDTENKESINSRRDAMIWSDPADSPFISNSGRNDKNKKMAAISATKTIKINIPNPVILISSVLLLPDMHSLAYLKQALRKPRSA